MSKLRLSSRRTSDEDIVLTGHYQELFHSMTTISAATQTTRHTVNLSASVASSVAGLHL